MYSSINHDNKIYMLYSQFQEQPNLTTPPIIKLESVLHNL